MTPDPGLGDDVQRYVLSQGWSVQADCEIHCDGKPTWQDGPMQLFAQGDHPSRFCLSFSGFPSFEVDFAARAIRIGGASACSAETVRHLLLDQVYPRLLAHEGEFVIHAAAIGLGSGAILLVGPSGSGKSTLGASYHSAGFALLGDDAIRLSRDAFRTGVRSVYPSLRLFEDSLAELLGRAMPTSPVADYLDKWNVDIGSSDAEPEELPLRAIVLIDPRDAEAVSLEVESGADICMGLVEQSFALDPTNTAQAKMRLRIASEIAEDVPVLRLMYPRHYEALPTVREAIGREVSRLETAES